MLPDDLYRIILTYAGSIRYDDQLRRNKFVRLEIEVWALLAYRELVVRPSDLLRFYRDHGRTRVENIMRDAFYFYRRRG